MLCLDSVFPHRYSCQVINEIPNTSVPHFNFSHDTRGRDGLILRVIPERFSEWIGTFAFGEFTSEGKNGVYTFPDPQKIVIISRGQGYIVDVNSPENYELIDSIPIIDVVQARQLHMVVLASLTYLIAYRCDGVAWKTHRISWDNLKIKNSKDTYIIGEYYDIRSEEDKEFRVNLENGDVIGGIEDQTESEG